MSSFRPMFNGLGAATAPAGVPPFLQLPPAAGGANVTFTYAGSPGETVSFPGQTMEVAYGGPGYEDGKPHFLYNHVTDGFVVSDVALGSPGVPVFWPNGPSHPLAFMRPVAAVQTSANGQDSAAPPPPAPSATLSLFGYSFPVWGVLAAGAAAVAFGPSLVKKL